MNWAGLVFLFIAAPALIPPIGTTWAQTNAISTALNAKLLDAAKTGEARALLSLLQQGADPNARDETFKSSLFYTVARGEAKIVRLLLDWKANPNLKDKDGVTPLMLAADLSKETRLEIVSMLVAAGADPDVQTSYGDTALRIAARNESNETLLFLIDKGAKAELQYSLNMGLLKASRSGDIDQVSFLLKKGANPNTQPVSYKGNGEISYKGDTPLLLAAKGGHKEAVTALLEAGSDPNKSGWQEQTAIVAAIHSANFELVPLLVKAGAHFDKREITKEIFGKSAFGGLLANGDNIDAKDKHGRTALMYASATAYGTSGSDRTARILLYLGASVNLRDKDGMTPLLHAVRSGNSDTVRLLLSNRADPNARDNRNNPALIFAIPGRSPQVLQKTAPDIVKMLLDRGADPNAQDEEGLTALMLAAGREYAEIVKILLANGASVEAKNKDGITAYQVSSGTEVIALLRQARAPGGQPWPKIPMSLDTRNKLLLEAAGYGNADLVKTLLAEGAETSPREIVLRQKAFFAALRTSQAAVVSLLLNSGVDAHTTDENNRTPLMVAIESSWQGQDNKVGLPVVKVLVGNGADINAKDKSGVTALARAAGLGHVNIVQFLLERGADPNLQDQDGRNALLYALDSNRTDRLVKVVPLLLSAGIHIDTKDGKGRSAADIATSRRMVNIVALLKGRSENSNPKGPAD